VAADPAPEARGARSALAARPDHHRTNGSHGPLHAVVLAGGPGRTLPPHTTPFPKPLVPLGGEHAVVEVVLRQLRAQGFDDVTLAVGDLGALVRAYCGDGAQWDLRLDYWWEDVPLGTIGALVGHAHQLPAEILVINGDSLSDMDYRAFLVDHMRSGASLSVATCPRTVRLDFGVAHLGGPDGLDIVGFDEKPMQRFVVAPGIYALSTRLLGRYVPGQPLGFDELVADLIRAGDPPRAVPHDGLFLDLTSADEYREANDRWSELAVRLLRDADPQPRDPMP
jgi:NDP-sugar pyrophosphorylase family protein